MAGGRARAGAKQAGHGRRPGAAGGRARAGEWRAARPAGRGGRAARAGEWRGQPTPVCERRGRESGGQRGQPAAVGEQCWRASGAAGRGRASGAGRRGGRVAPPDASGSGLTLGCLRAFALGMPVLCVFDFPLPRAARSGSRQRFSKKNISVFFF